MSYHDFARITGSADSTSLLHQYSSQELSGFSDGESVGTLPNQVGSTDATGSATYRAGGLNGFDVLDFDGSNDSYEASVSITAPYTVIAVVDGQGNLGGKAGITDSVSYRRSGIRWDGSNWKLDGYDSSITGTSDSSVQVVTGYLADGDSLLYEGNTLTASGNAGGRNVDGLRIGDVRDSGTGLWPGQIGYVEFHTGKPGAGIVSRIEEVAAEWGISF